MKYIISFIFSLILLFAVQVVFTHQVIAATACQVTYGGGEVCQGQALLRFSYPAPIIQPTTNEAQTSAPASLLMQHTPKALPSTGPSVFSYLLIIAAGIAGIAIHLFLI